MSTLRLCMWGARMACVVMFYCVALYVCLCEWGVCVGAWVGTFRLNCTERSSRLGKQMTTKLFSRSKTMSAGVCVFFISASKFVVQRACGWFRSCFFFRFSFECRMCSTFICQRPLWFLLTKSLSALHIAAAWFQSCTMLILSRMVSFLCSMDDRRSTPNRFLLL